MKGELKVFVFVSILVLSLSFFVFYAGEVTGQVVGEEIQGEIVGESEIILVDFEEKNYTESDAVLAIVDIKDFILELKENNFSSVYFNDSLTGAEILLEEGDWQSVGETRDILSERLYETYELYDNIILFNNSIQKYFSQGLDVSLAKEKFDLLEEAFYEERYSEVELLIDDLRLILEESRSEASVLASLNSSLRNFFVKNFKEIIGVIVVVGIISWLFLYLNSRRILKKRIRKMKAEEKVLNKLILKTQEKRFKEGTISGLVYNIRIKKYKEKLSEIGQRLPVLEQKLKRQKK